MSGWETAGTKKKSGTKKQKEAAFKPTTIKRAAHVEGTKTLFDIFNDVDADKQKKKEVQEKRAKKAAKAEKYTGAFTGEELSDPRTNFEKSMKAKQEKQKKANSTAKAAKKKDAAAADPAGGGAAARASIADVISRWDTPALLAKLAEIDETYDEDTQEHVMVLMIAEYLEEQFAGAGGDWAGLLGELDASDPYGLDAVAVEQPVVQLPKKSIDAICKRLRRFDSGAKAGLVAFLLSYTWQTLVGKKAGGIGVRMLLQLVARADAGAVASNLKMLPIPGMEKLRGDHIDPNAPATRQGKHPAINDADASHALSDATTVWVLKQLGTNSYNARTDVFSGWCSYLLPLLSHAKSSKLALAASLEIFGNASWEKMSLKPDERKPEKGSAAADWMIEPSQLKELLCLKLTGTEPLRAAALAICAKHGHAAGLYSPALFAQLLPLLAEGSGARNKKEVVTLLLECLATGGKTWANWVQTHTSAKALLFAPSSALVEALSVSPNAVRARMDRGKLIATVAEIRHFHQMSLDPEKPAGAKWSPALLKSGLKACEAIEADPTGVKLASSSGGSAVLWWLVMLFGILPVTIALVLNNTPALAPQVEILTKDVPQLREALGLVAQYQSLALKTFIQKIEELEKGGS